MTVESENSNNSHLNIFISYNHGDTAMMKKVFGYLEDCGYNVKCDQQDMRAYERIEDFIKNALDQADCILSLVSERSLKSAWVSLEMTAARNFDKTGKKWIPLRLDNSFQSDDVLDEAHEEIKARIREYGTRLKKVVDEGRTTGVFSEPHDRLVNLRDNFNDNIKELRSRLVIDISGKVFETGMQKTRERIAESYNQELKLEKEKVISRASTLGNGLPGGENDIHLIIARRIRELDIDAEKVKPAMQVNCDRQATRATFIKSYGQRVHHHHHQFYFVISPAKEMPASFAEYMLYELIEDKSNEHGKVIDYKWSKQFKDRLAYYPLPLGLDIESSKRKFNADFAKSFPASDLCFDEHVAHGFRTIKADYVLRIYEIHQEEWETMPEYLSWIMDSFARAREGARFITFFIFRTGNVSKSTSLLGRLLGRTGNQKDSTHKIRAKLDELVKKYPESSIIDEFGSVEEGHIVNWFSSNLGVSNKSELNKVFRALEDQLEHEDARKKELFSKTGTFDMDYIEHKLLKTAWRVAMEKNQNIHKK